MAFEEESNLLESFKALFYTSKVCGLYPHDFKQFYYNKTLKKSKLGTYIVIANILLLTVLYNLTVLVFENGSFENKDNLSIMLGIVLTYFSLFAVIVDAVVILINQEALGNLFAQINILDVELRSLKTYFHDKKTEKTIIYMIAASAIFDTCAFVATYVLVLDASSWLEFLWFFTAVPTFYSSLDKIWFNGVLMAFRDRFEAINVALEDIVQQHEKLKKNKKREKALNKDFLKVQKKQKILSMNMPNIKIHPTLLTPENCFGEIIETSIGSGDSALSIQSDLMNLLLIERKLTRFCQLHDTICRLAKQLNELWSFSMLILMGFGFTITTGYFYFFYCAGRNQPIPSLFNESKSFSITIWYSVYIIGRCVFPMYLSWKTSLASKRTGVCLHKCAVAADTNEIYEIVNHLSLKLINHAVDFSAFGYFSLDMKTLFGIIGGITSYLIILIQFNMAAEQVKTEKAATNKILAAEALNSSKFEAYTAPNVSSFAEFLLQWPKIPGEL